MNERIEKLSRELKKNKRTSDRLLLPLTISYKLTDQKNWLGPYKVLDAGGHGLRFLYPSVLNLDTELDLRIWLPDSKENPITTKAKVRWCQQSAPSSYAIGVKFKDLEKQDKDRYVSFFCDNILENYFSSKD